MKLTSNHQNEWFLINRSSFTPAPVSRRLLFKAIALALSLSVSAAQAAVSTADDTADRSDLTVCDLRNAIISANTDAATCPAGNDASAHSGAIGYWASENLRILVQSGPDFEVNTSLDLPYAGGDGNCSVSPGDCTLREAIDASNANPDASIITFASALLSPFPSTVTLGGTALPELKSDITIQGSGMTIAGGSGNAASGIFKTRSATVTLNNLNLQNGRTSQSGGAVHAYNANITINDSSVSGNSAGTTGGGIHVAFSQLSIFNSTVSGNVSNLSGGGIYGMQSQINLVNSTVSGNSTNSRGGGIYLGDSNSKMYDSTLMNNTASEGGGIYVGLFSGAKIENSIIAGSTGGDCNTNVSILYAVQANLIEDSSNCTFSGPAVQTGDPMLGSLADNGGPTLTHLPLEGSPVINAGNNAASFTRQATDQRGAGFPRIAFGTIDLGAVELQTDSPPQRTIFKDGFE